MFQETIKKYAGMDPRLQVSTRFAPATFTSLAIPVWPSTAKNRPHCDTRTHIVQLGKMEKALQLIQHQGRLKLQLVSPANCLGTAHFAPQQRWLCWCLDILSSGNHSRGFENGLFGSLMEKIHRCKKSQREIATHTRIHQSAAMSTRKSTGKLLSAQLSLQLQVVTYTGWNSGNSSKIHIRRTSKMFFLEPSTST